MVNFKIQHCTELFCSVLSNVQNFFHFFFQMMLVTQIWFIVICDDLYSVLFLQNRKWFKNLSKRSGMQPDDSFSSDVNIKYKYLCVL